LYYRKQTKGKNYAKLADTFRRTFDKEITARYTQRYQFTRHAKDRMIKYHLLKKQYPWSNLDRVIRLVQRDTARERMADKKKEYIKVFKAAKLSRENELEGSRKKLLEIKMAPEDD
jgi:hypothetical protein